MGAGEVKREDAGRRSTLAAVRTRERLPGRCWFGGSEGEWIREIYCACVGGITAFLSLMLLVMCII